jgi:ligand-binding SRPBCC domain-containing protein
MNSTRTVSIESVLAASPDAVWAVVGTMDGVNAELGPWIRMTVPRHLAGFRIEQAPLGETAFDSWVCFVGIPFDRHSLRLERVEPRSGFDEASRSWLQARWNHSRTLTPTATGGCVVHDRVEFEPRVSFLAPFAERVVRAVFRHRHGVLVRRFGAG